MKSADYVCSNRAHSMLTALNIEGCDHNGQKDSQTNRADLVTSASMDVTSGAVDIKHCPTPRLPLQSIVIWHI